MNADVIFLPDGPAIPGLIFRRFQGESDYPQMADLIAACKIADNVERSETAEDIARFYSHLVNCDPYRDMLFAETDGRVIAYGRAWWQDEGEGNRLFTHVGFVDPQWRGLGIGRALLGFLESRLREIAADHPTARPCLYHAFAFDTETAKTALLLRQGYAAVRYGYHMARSLSEPVEVAPMPAGLEVRPVGPECFRAVWEADQEAFRDHWGYIAGTEEDYRSWLDNPTFNPGLWQVGWDGDQIAGMVQNFVNEKENLEYNRRRGYTEGISVRRPWRRRGLARALLTRSLQMFKGMGMSEAALSVDTENLTGALRLYESVGFRVVKRETVYRKSLVVQGAAD